MFIKDQSTLRKQHTISVMLWKRHRNFFSFFTFKSYDTWHFTDQF